MTDNTYNGWTNYETWQAALWLSEADYRSTDSDSVEDMLRGLANADSLTGLASDIFNGWISSVNIHEICENNAEG